jgi:hypothetical protein
MRRLPTVSEMPRATACAASVALPRLPDDGEMSASALRGSRIHAHVTARFRKWSAPAIGKTKVSHIQLGKLRRYLGRGEMRCELAMSYDGSKVEVLGENIGRDYNRPGTLCGAADLVMVRPHLLVVDIKTGSLPVPHPRENWQLATLAMMALEAYDSASVTGAIATLNRDGSWSFESHTWSINDVVAIEKRINAARATWTEAHEAEESGWGATPTPGHWCRFCKCVCDANAFKSEAA